MSKRSGLGRGLGALIPSSGETGGTVTAVAAQTGLRIIPIGQIRPNPHQPRTQIEESQLAELAASIQTHGLIQPLIVTQSGETYTLIAGERRWRAGQLAGLSDIPVIVKEATPQEMLELALIENIQRADLNQLEEAYAYQQLIQEFSLTQEQVAQRVGKARSTIANLVRLLELPREVQQAISAGQISGTHARVLLGLPTPEMQINAMKQIMKLDLTVRQTDALVTELLATKRPSPRPRQQLSPEMTAMQNQFQQTLGTRVAIQKNGQSGRVILHFYSDEELQAIYEAIVPRATNGNE